MDQHPSEALWKVIAEFTRENNARDVMIERLRGQVEGVLGVIEEMKALEAAVQMTRDRIEEDLSELDRRQTATENQVGPVLQHYENRKADRRTLINEGVKYVMILTMTSISAFSLTPIVEFLAHLLKTGHP